MQRARPQELRTDVEPFAGPRDRLTPYDLHVVIEFTSIDRDPDRGDGSYLQTPARFNQAPRHAAVDEAHSTLSREHAQLLIGAGVK